jgi:hypothetical protein
MDPYPDPHITNADAKHCLLYYILWYIFSDYDLFIGGKDLIYCK